MANYTDTSQSSNSQTQFEMGAIANGSTKEDWMSKKWRPMMGWVYMSTCTFDFVIAPILWSILQAYSGGAVTSQWMPLTLQGAGLYHVAMGAVLGLTAFGRTQEKIPATTLHRSTSFWLWTHRTTSRFRFKKYQNYCKT